MIKKTVKIRLDSEMDMVAMLVQIANQYESDIYLQDAKHKFNAKSIMGMMTLSTVVSDEIEVVAEGADEETAVEYIAQYLQSENN